MMLADWKASSDQAKPAEPREELQLVAEEEPGGEKKEEWINEAIQLFGEDVKMKED